MISNFFRQLINSIGIVGRTIRAFFMRQVVGIVARFKRLTSLSRHAARAVPKAMSTVAVAGQKPSKREDYVETGRLYIAKSLLVIIIVFIIVFALLFYFLLWPKLESAFFVKHMYMEDARVATYSGKVVLYYDEKMDDKAFKGKLEEGLAQGSGKEYDLAGQLSFSGDFVDGVYEGKGEQYESGLISYSGEFSGGLRNGWGTGYDQGEVNYIGEYFMDAYGGSGTLYYPGGKTAYKGNFSFGAKDGQGVEYHENGTIKYKGEFFQDHYEGNGSAYDLSGQPAYVGSFSQGQYSGSGTLFLENDQTLVGNFERGQPVGEVSIYQTGKLSYFGTTERAIPSGYGTLYSLNTGAPIYTGVMLDGTVDLQGLLALSLDEITAACAEAPITEERNGDAGFSVINPALGLTAFLNLKTQDEDPQVLRVYKYEGGDESYLTVNDELSDLSVTSIVSRLGSQYEALDGLSAAESRSALPAGSLPFRSGSYHRSQYTMDGYSYSIWRDSVGGKTIMLQCDSTVSLGGGSSKGNSAGSDAIAGRTDRLLAQLGLIPSYDPAKVAAEKQNQYYGKADANALFQDETLSLTEKASILNAMVDYLEAAEKREMYESIYSLRSDQLSRAKERFATGEETRATVSELERKLSSLNLQMNQCTMAMERAQIIVSDLTGLSLKQYDLQRVLFILDPSAINADELYSAVVNAGTNSTSEVKLELLNLELQYQTILDAQGYYESQVEAIAEVTDRFKLGKATQDDLDNSTIASLEACMTLYESMADYSRQMVTINRMGGGWLATKYSWYPAAFTPPVTPPAPVAPQTPVVPPEPVSPEGVQETISEGGEALG